MSHSQLYPKNLEMSFFILRKNSLFLLLFRYYSESHIYASETRKDVVTIQHVFSNFLTILLLLKLSFKGYHREFDMPMFY